MAVYNLPLEADFTHGDLKAAKIGAWRTFGSLDGLASGLPIEKRTDVAPDALKSIPDAWAQVQLVHDALFDSTHEAHDQVRAQWRALLTLFALQPTHKDDYTLSIDSFDFATTKEEEQGRAKGQGPRPTRLRSVLEELIPQGAVASEAKWSRLGVVDFIARGERFEALAMLSPVTLVAPGRRIALLDGPLPWKGGSIADPTVAGGLRRGAWTILEKYLDQLVTGLRKLGGLADRPDDREKLIGQIEAFKKDCATRKQGGGPAPEPAEIGNLAYPSPFFGMLGRTWTSGGPADLDCALTVRPRNVAASKAQFMLVDASVARALEREEHDVSVWGGATLGELADETLFADRRAAAAKKGVVLLRAEDFFADTFVRFQAGAEAEFNPDDFKRSLVPLSPLALLFFDGHSELSQSVSLEASADGVDVVLRVPLAAGKTALLRRRYGPAETIEMPAPGDLALWPNFEEKDWHWNYLRFEYNPKAELVTRFGASRELILADVAGGALDEDKAKRALEWGSGRCEVEARVTPSRSSELTGPSGETILQRIRFAAVSDSIGEHHWVPHGVEAVFFATPPSRERGSVPAGCVLVDRPASTSDDSREATVAVDFGTSNTIAFVDTVRKGLRRIAFQNRLVFPAGRNDAALPLQYADFFPMIDHDMPLPTVLKERQISGTPTDEIRAFAADPDPNLRPLPVGFTHLAFFTPRLASGSYLALSESVKNGQLKFDLKWSDSSKDRPLVRVYLRQLMLMIAAELRQSGIRTNDIQWRFSFPQAFTQDQESQFRSTLEDILKGIRDEKAEVQAALPLMVQTEAEAAAAYFAVDRDQENAGSSQLILMLDIGGGTTDFAVRLDKALIWQGSVRVAGSHFFRDYLVNNPKLVTDIDPNQMKEIEQASSERSLTTAESRRSQLVNLFVARATFHREFERAYLNHANDPVWVGLRQCAETALGGMMHYLGLVLHLLQDEHPRLRDMRSIDILFGGRGATYFKHLGGSRPSDSPLASLCRLAVERAGWAADGFAVFPVFSGQPKEEVGRGLLLADPAAGRPKTPVLLPLGLDILAQAENGRERFGPEERLERLYDAQGIEDILLDEFDAFLKGLREHAGFSIDLSSSAAQKAVRGRTLAKIGPTIRGMSRRVRDQRNPQSLEAPFTTALRCLVEQMAGPVEERNRLLGVEQLGSGR
ncbi:MAG TPA: hypothetical protein VE891_13335 [Allosphingosinicella sp.]|nr:hypothetical protein [Allosphingosinicella sp.]